MNRRAVLLLALAAFAPAFAAAYDAAAMVDSSVGTMPLILTVPHDGNEPLGTTPARKKGVFVRDENTRETAEAVARALEARTGKRPYIVIAKAARKYVDPNRPEDEALESPEALPAYRAYHDRVAAYVAEVKAKYPGAGLLVDVHGQKAEPDAVLRGTRAGLTTKRLVDRFGTKAIQGGDSLIGLLAAKGYKVYPAVDAASLTEMQGYTGGFTVFHYGSQNAAGIDAIQLELGRNLRNSARFAEDLAEALVKFMDKYGLEPADKATSRGAS